MNIYDYIILILLITAVAFVLRYIFKRKSLGCSGCSGCSKSASCNSKHH